MLDVSFAAPWDRTVLLMTVGFVALILLGVAVLLRAALGISGHRYGTVGRIAAGVFAVAMMATTGYAFATAPKRFSVSSDAIVVHRWGRDVRLPFSRVRGVELIPRQTLAGSSREFGSGGMFGAYGTFSNSRLGRYTLYATRSRGYVLIRTDERPMVVTPVPADQFVALVASKLSAPSAGAAR